MKLFLAPHNDDEVLFGTFTLLREQPHVIVCLKSERMGTPGYPPPLIDAETRETETDAAMDVLGCEWTQWEFSDANPDWRQVAMRMNLLDADEVYAPAIENGGHEQHSRIGELADEVFGDRVTHYLTYTNGRQRSWQGYPVAYDPDWLEVKRQALACYRSQIAHPMTGHHFSAPLDEFYAI